ncbi:MAG: oligosaccharide flippase family protein [Butyrivibrio sp.]
MKRLGKNIIYQTAYQILAILLPLITTPIVTRNLGADKLGQYSYTFAIVSYFAIFALLGVNTYGTREISRVRTENDRKKLSQVFSEIYCLQIYTSILVIIVYLVYAFFIAGHYRVLSIVQGIYLLSVLTDISWFYFGIEEFKLTVTRNIIVKIISAAIIIFMIKSPEDIYLYTATIIGSSFLSNIFLIAHLNKYVDFKFLGGKNVIRHLKPNLVLFIPVIAASVFVYMDKIMIGSISDTVQTGYYEAMEKILNVPVAFITALTTVMFPRISSMVKLDDSGKVGRYVEISVIGVVAFSIACIMGMLGIYDVFVPAFLGEEFSNAAMIVMLGMIIVLPRGIRGIIKSECLLPNGKDKQVIIAISVGSGVNLIVNFALIPKFGALGAVYATILSECVTCVLMFIFSGNKKLIIKSLIFSLPFLAFGGVMYLAIELIRDNTVFSSAVKEIIVNVLCGGGIYIALSGLYLYILLLHNKRKSDKN